MWDPEVTATDGGWPGSRVDVGLLALPDGSAVAGEPCEEGTGLGDCLEWLVWERPQTVRRGCSLRWLGPASGLPAARSRLRTLGRVKAWATGYRGSHFVGRVG